MRSIRDELFERTILSTWGRIRTRQTLASFALRKEGASEENMCNSLQLIGETLTAKPALCCRHVGGHVEDCSQNKSAI